LLSLAAKVGIFYGPAVTVWSDGETRPAVSAVHLAATGKQTNTFILFTVVVRICFFLSLLPLTRRLGFTLFVCLFVRSFVRSLAELCKNYSTDFHKILWKGDTRATEEVVRFWL